MAKEITAKKFTSNVIISICVQIVSLLVSFLLNLIVPKFIDEYQYSYWQMYVLYSGYVGVLHFGLLDGIVLRYSQYDYEELDKERIRSQFIVLLLFTTLLSFISLCVAFFSLQNEYKWIVAFVGIAIITKNFYTYSQYTFQITNRINKYAIVVLAQRIVYGIFVATLLLLKVNNFVYYCFADVFGDLIAIFLGSFFNKGMYFGKTISIKETFAELKENISAGILLMIANWSSMFIVGSAKMIVSWHWDELLFGKISLAFSLTNLFYTFITAISVVLFPSLKRLEQDKLPSIYVKIRSSISLLLFFVMIGYYPCCWILGKWLPKYSPSFVYLGFLLPIIIFSSKVSLLTNNYLKVYRKEKFMMIINVCSVCLAIILFLLSSYVFNCIELLLCCIVFIIMFNSIASEIVVSKVINVNNKKNFIVEFLMVVLFIVSSSVIGGWLGTAMYFVAYVIYLIINKNSVNDFICKLKSKINRKI